MREIGAPSIPAPVSCTRSNRNVPGCTSPTAATGSGSPSGTVSRSVLIVMTPARSSIASAEFMSRLVMSCTICDRSAYSGGSLSLRSVWILISSGIDGKTSSTASRTISDRSSKPGQAIPLPAYASSWPVKCAARSPDAMILSSIPCMAESVGTACMARIALPKTLVNKLLKSCAIPPARSPTLSICWAFQRCSSARLCSVTSPSTPTAYCRRPLGSRAKLIRNATMRSDPSLRTWRLSSWQKGGSHSPDLARYWSLSITSSSSEVSRK